MKNRTIAYLTGALLLPFLVQLAAGARHYAPGGTLHGTVTDPSGAAIPDASVMVSQGNFLHTVSTDENGAFVISGLLQGHYRVRVYSPGFARFEKSGLVVSAGYQTEANAELIIDALKQEITVTDAPLD